MFDTAKENIYSVLVHSKKNVLHTKFVGSFTATGLEVSFQLL